MKTISLLLFALLVAKASALVPPRDPDRSEVIAEFDQRFVKEDIIAKLETVKEPVHRFIEIVAALVELQSILDELSSSGQSGMHFIFYDKSGIPQPVGLRAEYIKDPEERKRFIEEKKCFDRNNECINAVVSLRQKLSTMLAIIEIREHADDNLKRAYRGLQMAVEESSVPYAQIVRRRADARKNK